MQGIGNNMCKAMLIIKNAEWGALWQKTVMEFLILKINACLGRVDFFFTLLLGQQIGATIMSC